MSKNSSLPPEYTPVSQQPPSGNPIVITTVPTTVVHANFGPNSQVFICPHCNHSISTRVETKATTKTHLIALCLCLFVCWPCCLCPYCIDSCQAKNHYCPQCGAFLGTYSN